MLHNETAEPFNCFNSDQNIGIVKKSWAHMLNDIFDKFGILLDGFAVCFAGYKGSHSDYHELTC